jgi:hypothetical protein
MLRISGTKEGEVTGRLRMWQKEATIDALPPVLLQ